jgi:predicted metalloprotease
MRWKGRRQSENVEDRRGISGPTAVVGGGIGVVILARIVMALGGDPSALLQGGGAPGGGQPTVQQSQEAQEKKEFVAVVLADTEDVWDELFRERGSTYRKPTLVLFTGQVQSACGFASAAVGPFYCGEDEKVYIDLSFYEDLKRKFGAPGDFAQAYVIAHEIGHHVQNQLGVLDKVHSQQRRMSKEEFNRLSVRLELQADFFAGVWAHHAQKMQNILDRDDIEEAIGAASAIGDDRLQQQAQGYVVPESFTHGTSEQRVRWFRKGWDTGDLRQGDTFNTRNL